MFIGVIPAKLESRRIQRKNIKALGDLPLLAYTLRAALHSRLIDRLVVSTDSDIVERIALQYGEQRTEVLRRGEHLATDVTTTEAVLLDVAERIGARDEDAVVTLLPTSPFRSRDLIDRCIGVFQSHHADSVLTVRRDTLKLGRLDSDQRFAMSRHYPAEMHKVEPVWIDNPAVYVTRVSALRANGFVLGEKCYGLEIDRVEGHDINDPLDWLIAEAVLAHVLFTPDVPS